MRKEANFEILDKIYVYYNGDAEVEEIINKYQENIKQEVLALEIKKSINDVKGHLTKQWTVNGCNLIITVKNDEN